jgi:hypothetical protein
MSLLKSYTKHIVILVICCFSLKSCKLDELPTDRYTEGTIWADPGSIELYINDMYQEFRRFQFGTFPVGYDNATDGLTDILKYTSSASGNGTVNILATDASRFNSASPGLNYWASAYTRIRRLNEFLEGIHKHAQIDNAKRLSYEAEARFIRGYVYFWLVKLHGCVILMKELNDHTKKDMARSSENDCWNFIASDFEFAANYLPKTWKTIDGGKFEGKATKGAALSMLARTWIYAASVAEFDKKQFNQDPLTGVPAAQAQTYYTNAMNAAQGVVDLANEGLYALDADFANIFQNKNSTESIFRIDFVSQLLTHQYDFGFVPPGDDPGQTMVYGVPTANLVDEFEMADGNKFSWSTPAMANNPYTNREKRFYASILYNGAVWKGRTLNTTVDGPLDGFVAYGSMSEPRKTVTGYYAKKMLDSKNTNFTLNKSTQSWHEIRYAEVILILAEAKAMLNDLPGARTALNKLRLIRGLPDTPANNKTDFMKAIEHERIVELAFEGHRYWDLRRWRKAHLTLNNTRFRGHKISTIGVGLNYESVSADDRDRQFYPSLYYLPILDTEVQRNGLLTQIQGW